MTRVFSGMQPSGAPHLGNYLGAWVNWLALQETADETIYCVVDLHAITSPVEHDPATLRRHLAEIREAGFVVTTGQVDAHATGIGVPVFVNGRLLCALSIAGPSVRFREEKIREVVELVRAEAAGLGGPALT